MEIQTLGYSLDDVGQGYDLVLMDRERTVVTLGRHSNDLMTSFYTRTPSDYLSSTAGAAATSMTQPAAEGTPNPREIPWHMLLAL